MNAITKIPAEVAHDRERLVRLAKSLASPVAKGFLSPNHADAVLLAAALRAARIGELRTDPIEFARILSHVVRLFAANLAVRRSLTRWKLEQAIVPLIATGAMSHRLLAAAHNSNAKCGCPLHEYEVEQVVTAILASEMGGEA